MAREESDWGRLVARVEAGAALSEAELARLERAVERRPESVDWLLCLAHALVNGDLPERALPLLERAEALRPGEVLVLLARARALAALERYPEAEALLRAVLARHGAHADAGRALALLLLRRGAREEARALASQVLAVDPFDEETRQILGEAEAGPGAEARPAAGGAEAFVAALRRSLAAQGLRARIDPGADAVVVSLPPGPQARLSLAVLRAEAAAHAAGAEGYLAGLALGLARLRAPGPAPGLEAVRERVFPVLRPRSFLSTSGPALSLPAPAGLLWLFALDDPEFVTYLPPRAAEGWAMEPEALLALALQNLERAPVAPAPYRAARGRLSPAEGGPWDLLAFDEGDGYDASRLLSAAHRALLARAAPGPFAAALPTRSCALLAPLGREEAVALLRAIVASQAAGGEGLCRDLFRLDDDGELHPLDPPTG